MLDNEPNDPTTPADEAPAAPVKAVRRRRATKAAAPAAEPEAATPSATEPPTTDAPVALEGGVSAAGETAGAVQDPAVDATTEAPTVAATEEPAAPAKRVRKTAAKKAAPRKRVSRAGAGGEPVEPAEATPAADQPELSAGDQAVAEVLTAPAEPVVDAVEDDPAVAESTSDDAVPEALVALGEQTVAAAEAPGEPDATADLQPEPAPAPRTRRRRAPAVVTFQAPVEPEAEAVETASDTDTAAGETAAPRRRRRAGTAGALAPSALLPTLLAPEPAPPAARDDDTDEPTGGTGPDLDDSEDGEDGDRPRRRRRGRRGRGPRRDEGDDNTTTAEGDDESAPAEAEEPAAEGAEDEELNADGTVRRRRRRRRSGSGGAGSTDEAADDVPTVVHVREPRAARVRGASAADEDGVRGITGSTRMAAKRARRQEGRDSGRRRPPVLSEAEFLARREAVDRTMVVRQQGDRTQIAVLEDGVLVEHYVTKASAQSYAGNVYLGKVQNVLPSMEAAFVDIGKGKNGVLYAGEVNYDAQLAGHGPRKIESVLKSGQDVLVQVSKDPIGHKGARLTSQVSLPGRYLVYVPEGSMTGISRKLPDTERSRLKSILKKIVPDDAGVIIRTAAEGASEEELTADVRRLQAQWETISTKAKQGGGPVQLHAEPDLVIRVVRDVFNEDFTSLVVQGDSEWDTIRDYVEFVAPDLGPRLSRHEGDVDVFAAHRVDEQLAKALDRKVWLPSGGSLVIDRTEAMVVIDVNTGKYVGKGGNLEETVTRNNLEAAEEIARQLRLRDLGGIIVVDFIDMVLESNRDLVVRRLVECLGRDRTKHQVAEVTSLGLVQMTRKRVGQGLLESFSETCEACGGRGVIVHAGGSDHRDHRDHGPASGGGSDSGRARRRDTAGPALVAAAAHRSGTGTAVPAAAGDADALGTEDGAAEGSGTAEANGDAGAERTGRGRRRRGGRGAGAARAAAAAEAKQEAEDADGPADPDDAALSPDVQDLADLAPDLVPELSDQPTAAEEDVPVLEPDALFGGGPTPETADPETDGPETDGPETADPETDGPAAVDAEAVDAAPVAVDLQPEPEAAPEVVEVAETSDAAETPEAPVPAQAAEPAEAAPRRRRRATSRPAGPPTA